MRAWVEVMPDGTLGRVLLTRTEMPAPWMLLEPPWRTPVRATPHRYRVDDGVLSQKRAARLSVSTEAFNADGEDHAGVMVVALEPQPGDELLSVALTVNGEPVALDLGEVLELRSNYEGSFTIRLWDPLFYAEPTERRTAAYAEEEQDV